MLMRTTTCSSGEQFAITRDTTDRMVTMSIVARYSSWGLPGRPPCTNGSGSAGGIGDFWATMTTRPPAESLGDSELSSSFDDFYNVNRNASIIVLSYYEIISGSVKNVVKSSPKTIKRVTDETIPRRVQTPSPEWEWRHRSMFKWHSVRRTYAHNRSTTDSFTSKLWNRNWGELLGTLRKEIQAHQGHYAYRTTHNSTFLSVCRDLSVRCSFGNNVWRTPDTVVHGSDNTEIKTKAV